MRFEFATAGRIVFGPGTVRELGALAKDLGARALVVTGRHPERAQAARLQLDGPGIASVMFAVAGEPTTHCIMEGVALVERERCDFVVAFGGGSVLDAAKAIGALAANGGDLFDYLEVVGRGKPLLRPSLPVIAIPTTSGTGCEVTRNAVLLSPEHRFKVSLRSPFLLPRFAIVDPELTLDLPRSVTISTGLDALTQLIEPYISTRTNPMTDALCVEGIRRVLRSLPRVCQTPSDLAAREDMALASLFSGMALANAGLGAVHGFAAPIGGMFDAPHGAVCAALLPHVLEANVQAMRQRCPESPSLHRFNELAVLLTGCQGALAEGAVKVISGLCAALDVPPLRSHGITRDDVPVIVEKSLQASSMKANPIALTREELSEIIIRAL